MLETYTPSQIRLLFLLNLWDRPMDYDPLGQSFEQAVAIDKTFKNFFSLVQSLSKSNNLHQKWSASEQKLVFQYKETVQQVHNFLCDNFNTVGVVVGLRSLVGDVNSYVNNSSGLICSAIVETIARYIYRILKMLGVIEERHFEYCPSSATDTALEPLVDCVSDFRVEVRVAAQELRRNCKSIPPPSQAVVTALAERLLSSCDTLRDEKLIEFGIQIEDRSDGRTIWKQSTKDAILKERNKKLEEVAKKKREKEDKALAALSQS